MRKFALLFTAVALVACDRSKPALEKALAQSQQISAEKDSLLKDVTATSQFLAEVSSTLATVRTNAKPTAAKEGDAASMTSPSDQRAMLLSQIKAVASRLNDAENRLAASRKRVSDLTGNNAEMSKQLAAYDSTISAFKTMIENQKTELASLQTQVTQLTGENTQLKADNVQLVSDKTSLTGERDHLTTEKNTVYYVIGTKGDLIKRHIIEQTGGMLGIGKTQVPARDLNPSEFTSIDKTQVQEIPLPKPGTAYKVITRQDLASLDSAPDSKGRLTGSIKIKDPVTFWANSKFLIVIEQ